MVRRSKAKISFFVGISALSGLAALPALIREARAQAAVAQGAVVQGAVVHDETSSTSTAVERVEVTGSHIKRIAVEGAAPITTVTRKELDKSGYNSISDVLRETGASSFGGIREQSGSNAAGVAHVNLRGLGADNTLVLLNGQRLPTDAVTGAVDLNLIPMAAVERIEVLKDGASATYGSDALGGVVNIITRKDFEGSEARVSQTIPDAKGGARREVGLVNGLNTEKLNVVTVAQFRDNEVVFARDRDWTKKSKSLLGGPGSYRSDGAGAQWVADANCPADRLEVTPQGTFCTYNPADQMTVLPQLQQFSLMSEGNYELSSRVKMSLRVGGTRRLVNWAFAPAPGTFKIPAAVADTLGPNGGPLPGATTGQDLNIRYRLTSLGNRDTEVTTYAYNFLAGSAIQLSDAWQLDVTTAHNAVRSEDEGVNGYALTAGLIEAIRSGQHNPFAPEGQKGSLDQIRYKPMEKTTSLLSSAELKASGGLFEIGENTVSMALGATTTHQSFRDVFDEKSVNNEVFGNAGSSGGGQRLTQGLFSELSVPMLGTALELQLAGRFDHYSDFGNTANPKAAVLVRPASSVLLRASAGTGFKAPLMQQMYSASSLGFPTFVDASACNAEKAAGGATPSCLPQQYQVTTSGNPGLKEEKSVSFNVGGIFEPVKAFSIGVDAFTTRQKNVVGIDYDAAMKAEAMGINLAQHGVTVKRDANGYIDEIEAPTQNLSARQVSGLDLSTAIRPVADIKLSVEHSRLFHYLEEGFPGAGKLNVIDTNGKPRWRNTVAVTYSPNDVHDLALSALTIAGQEKSVADLGRISNYTQLDLAYALKTKSIGTFSLGVKNLLGTTPPLDSSVPNEQLNTDLYDQIGRQFVVGYSKTF